MGVISSLALMLIPLLRRDSSTTPRQVPIDSGAKRLKAEAHGGLESRSISSALTFSCGWISPSPGASRPKRERCRCIQDQRRSASADRSADASPGAVQPAASDGGAATSTAQNGQYLSGLGNFRKAAQQSSFGQGSVWGDCTCVPGHSALLREES